MSERPLQPAPIAALAVATAVPGLFGFFLPDVLGSTAHDPALVRLQQTKAAAASLLLGAACSAVSRTPWPFLLSLGLTGVLMIEYESVRRRVAS
jgi:hypothetical protein